MTSIRIHEVIVFIAVCRPGITDDELADAIYGKRGASTRHLRTLRRGYIAKECSRLEQVGTIERRSRRLLGAIGNFPAKYINEQLDSSNLWVASISSYP